MHRILKVSLGVILVMLFSSIISPVEADRRDLFCFLQASSLDVKIEVWEEDKRGNKGQLIWRGLVKQGQRQRIDTRTGAIRYASNIYLDTTNASSGDTSRWCEEGTTIGVP